ncbi:SDR family NAD(P)-dependent oxidoreductase [Nesterenkonia ebinurensis]|uniref:SDR family NAD(P)-dependent oxidoreductase n=1 Tax=Nesterenkonia ebinurensis TaxID=2608252 RepID=UPI00295E7C4E|nr:SDR family NAD(P)-dependent oxidoreductase [Nesterenkonia ebinurensis]
MDLYRWLPTAWNEKESGNETCPLGFQTTPHNFLAGATRGAGRGIAVELGVAGATVYVTGRSTRFSSSEYARPETIEETGELVTAAGGVGIAVPTDHLDSEQVAALVAQIDAEHGRLDILVNDIWGGELLTVFDTPVWEHPSRMGCGCCVWPSTPT